MSKPVKNQNNSKTILITGCDSGFGRSLAEHLSAKGHHVFAGCLTQEGVKSLSQSSPTVAAFLLDVTKNEDVQKAVELVTRLSPRGLQGLVNNAGILTGTIIEWSEISDWQKMMDVNFYGMLRVTQGFIPLLKKAQGTIVNITSTAGILVVPTMTGYSCSKFAAEALSDGLRRELSPFGIKVAIVQPVVMKTPIVQFQAKFIAEWEKLSPAMKEDYPPAYFKTMSKRMKELDESAEDPAQVVRAIEGLLTSPNPKSRTMVGALEMKLFTMIPTWAFDALISWNYNRDLKPVKAKL